jgi:hypothetical protein
MKRPPGSQPPGCPAGWARRTPPPTRGARILAPLLALAAALPAADPAADPNPPAGSGADAAADAAADGAQALPLTIPGLTARALAVVHMDGASDPGDLEAMLRDINQSVAGHLLVDPDRSQEAELAASDGAAAPDQWRLWAFWAIDVPACTGLAEALVAVRASGLAQVRPVHLCSLRHWEAWFGRMDRWREQLLAAARAQDQAGCAAVSAAWRAAVAPGDAMIRCFSQHGLPVLGDARMAVALQVDQVPSFRLVAPDHHVHALAGFAPGVDLVRWIRTCQDWDAAQATGAGR